MLLIHSFCLFHDSFSAKEIAELGNFPMMTHLHWRVAIKLCTGLCLKFGNWLDLTYTIWLDVSTLESYFRGYVSTSVVIEHKNSLNQKYIAIVQLHNKGSNSIFWLTANMTVKSPAARSMPFRKHHFSPKLGGVMQTCRLNLHDVCKILSDI